MADWYNSILHSYELYNKQTYQDGKPPSANLIFQIITARPQGHVSNVYELILDSSIPIATKFDMTGDHHALALPV